MQMNNRKRFSSPAPTLFKGIFWLLLNRDISLKEIYKCPEIWDLCPSFFFLYYFNRKSKSKKNWVKGQNKYKRNFFKNFYSSTFSPFPLWPFGTFHTKKEKKNISKSFFSFLIMDSFSNSIFIPIIKSKSKTINSRIIINL